VLCVCVRACVSAEAHPISPTRAALSLIFLIHPRALLAKFHHTPHTRSTHSSFPPHSHIKPIRTWEWETSRIRSFVHPLLFTAFYALLQSTGLATRAAVAYGPSVVVQALLTATTDLHVYWLGKRVVATHEEGGGGGGGGREGGGGEAVGRWALFFQCTNWFMWYAGVRTFSSSFEMALLVPAVYHWLTLVDFMTKNKGGREEAAYLLPAGTVSWEEPLALVLGALSIIVRPTAVFAWVPLGLWRLYHTRFADLPRYLLMVVLPWTGLVFVGNVLLDSYCYSLLPSLGADPSTSFRDWLVLTPLNFLRINLVADVASQYGTHPFHWYFTLGALTVLTTHLPFLLLGLRRAFSRSSSPFSSSAATSLWLLAFVVIIYPLGLSLSPHKEFRFLLPVIPLAFVLAGAATVNDILPSSSSSSPSSPTPSSSHSPNKRNRRRHKKRHPFLLPVLLLVLTHAPVALYFSRVHQRGPIDVMSYLSARLEADVQLEQRQQQEQKQERAKGAREGRDVRIDFLMPCHATPWTTHMHVPAFFSSSSSYSSSPPSLPHRRLLLQHLDCSPNLHGHASQATATDEFLLDPLGYATQRYGEKSGGGSSSSSGGGLKGTSSSLPSSLAPSLPDYIVAFNSAAREMEKFLVSVKGYQVDAMLFHSAFKGDVDSPRHEDSIIVFALGGEHRSASSLSSSYSGTKEEL